MSRQEPVRDPRNLIYKSNLIETMRYKKRLRKKQVWDPN